MTLTKQMVDYHNFLVGYMGYSPEEVAFSVYLTHDYTTCVLKMLSLWRCKHVQGRVKTGRCKDGQGGVKTVGELLSALNGVLCSGPYKVLVKCISGKCSTSSLNDG